MFLSHLSYPHHGKQAFYHSPSDKYTIADDRSWFCLQVVSRIDQSQPGRVYFTGSQRSELFSSEERTQTRRVFTLRQVRSFQFNRDHCWRLSWLNVSKTQTDLCIHAASGLFHKRKLSHVWQVATEAFTNKGHPMFSYFFLAKVRPKTTAPTLNTPKVT